MYVMYYMPLLWWWQLVMILIKTNHPSLRVGCHNHRVDVPIKIMKYLNGRDNGCIGAQMSP
jgi:hypothetical protein